MLPLYENVKDNLEIYQGEARHIPPHLHKSLECIYVTKGSLEIGTGQELHHMDTHDLAIVFPDLIHHYQVFGKSPNHIICLLASPSLAGGYVQTLQKYCPVSPVIQSDLVHPDIKYALKSLLRYPAPREHAPALRQAYTQILLARSLPFLELTDKSFMETGDIVYQTVSYIAANFTEDLSLEQMARDLGNSPYVLSRMFSGTFHCNFNTYLNEVRLDHACNNLLHTDQSITEIYENAGFPSQRTFNRVFKEKFHMTPKEYRNSHKNY